jgi:hypothetical protein
VAAEKRKFILAQRFGMIKVTCYSIRHRGDARSLSVQSRHSIKKHSDTVEKVLLLAGAH